MAIISKVVAIVIVIVLILAAIGIGLFLTSKPKDGDHQTNSVIIIDDRGRNVSVVKYPQRIVSLGATFTETLYAINASNQVVAVDEGSDYPSAVQAKTHLGLYYDIAVGDVTALDPDLVITYVNSSSLISGLEAEGVTVLAFNPRTIGDVLYLIETLGTATGNADHAGQVVEGLEIRIENVQRAVDELDESQKVTAYVELRSGASPGYGTFIDDIIVMAGGLNINTMNGFRTLDSSFTIGADPDAIILESQSNLTDQDLEGRPGWEEISAIKSGHIYRVDGDLLVPGPRSILALEQFAEWFYPELF